MEKLFRFHRNSFQSNLLTLNMQMTEEVQISGTTKFQPVWFSEKEISMFCAVSCKGMITVATTISNPESPLWVNFVLLTNFTKLYLYYWNRPYHANTSVAVEQRILLRNILYKITHVFSLAVRHDCVVDDAVDLRKLLKAAVATKKENQFLASYPHHEYDILEIEKVGLEFAKTEVAYDILDEAKIKDLIIFSKLMAYQLHGIKL